MLPNVDDKDLTRRKCEKSTLALKVLVLAALAAVGTLDVHDEDVVGHAQVGVFVRDLVLGHPDTLGRLPALTVRHDGELRAKEIVQERRLARRLRSEDRDKVVVEAGVGDILEREILGQVWTVTKSSQLQDTTKMCKHDLEVKYLKSFSPSMTCTPCS